MNNVGMNNASYEDCQVSVSIVHDCYYFVWGEGAHNIISLFKGQWYWPTWLSNVKYGWWNSQIFIH